MVCELLYRKGDGLVVDVKDHMCSCELISPPTDGFKHCEEFFELDVVSVEASRDSTRKPLGSKDGTQTLPTARVGVDVQDRAAWDNEPNSVPLADEFEPPAYVIFRSPWDGPD